MTSYVRISTPSRAASSRAAAFGRTLKPTIRASEADASMMSFCVIAPTPSAITFRRTSGCSNLDSSETTASTEPTTSPDDEVEIRDLAGLELLEQPLEGDAGRPRRRELLAAEPLAPPVREVARLPVVRDDPRELPRAGWLVEAEDLDRVPRPGALP